jgi:23S rRNA G2445 N2-methylase RlmL
LGFTIEDSFVTGVRINATINDCIKLNLNLRCASQVLYSLQSFMATDADAIHQHLKSYPWENIIPNLVIFLLLAMFKTIPLTIACLPTYVLKMLL